MLRSFGWLMFFVLIAGAALADDQVTCTKKCASGVEVAMIFETEKLQVIEPVEVELQVRNADGTPASNATIYCSMFMPMVATGSNRPTFKPSGEGGSYRGVVFFERAGLWHANLTINLANGTYEDITIEIGDVAAAGG